MSKLSLDLRAQSPTLETEIPYGDDMVPVLVEYGYLSGYPGVYSGPPDRWAPPDPPEVEILCVEIAEGPLEGTEVEVTEELYDYLYNVVVNHVEEDDFDVPEDLS